MITCEVKPDKRTLCIPGKLTTTIVCACDESEGMHKHNEVFPQHMECMYKHILSCCQSAFLDAESDVNMHVEGEDSYVHTCSVHHSRVLIWQCKDSLMSNIDTVNLTPLYYCKTNKFLMLHTTTASEAILFH